MKTIVLDLNHDENYVVLNLEDNGNCVVQNGLNRLVCPCCSESNCFRSCDGSKGADELMETETDYRYRITHNIFVSGVEAMIIELAKAGLFDTHRDSVIECINNVLSTMP